MNISKFDTADMERKITDFEQKYGITLPEQYRGFMRRYNGGITPETDFKSRAESSDVRAFYGIGAEDYYSFENVFEKELQLSETLPSLLKRHLLPVAADSFGNFFAIGLSEENCGKIYFCDHEKNLTAKLLTETFAEFIKKCKSAPVKEFHKRTPEEREQGMIARGDGGLITDELRQRWKEDYEFYRNIHLEKVVIS